ncbi:hypothetical protein [Haloechinothrix salitolerans]|uniref:Uncharacterized protein n=1 Tax=Haloechinothrix salitolerans TaxID=926830 RepID=A0ABW2CA38_9PSEU
MSRSLAFEPTAHFFEPHEYYDPRDLVQPVADLLTERGRSPKLDDEGESLRLAGATELLVGLGVTPTVTYDVGVEHEPGRSYFEPFHVYNPDHLAQEVAELLNQNSLRPMSGMYEGSLLRRRGASMLLRGYGIMPGFKTEYWASLDHRIQ